MVEDMKKRAQIMNEFDSFRISQGGIINDAVLKRFIEISEMDVMKNDPNVKSILI